jgi:hypothetical protein
MTAIFFVTTKFTLLPRLEKYRKLILSMEIVLHCNVSNSVTDPGRFGTDPDPRIRTTDQCCGSGISDISDPGSLIPDPKTATKERGEKSHKENKRQ